MLFENNMLLSCLNSVAAIKRIGFLFFIDNINVLQLTILFLYLIDYYYYYSEESSLAYFRNAFSLLKSFIIADCKLASTKIVRVILLPDKSALYKFAHIKFDFFILQLRKLQFFISAYMNNVWVRSEFAKLQLLS